MSGRKIFIVTRDVGSYEDRTITNLVAFVDEAAAQTFVESLQKWFSEHPRPSFDDVWDAEACEISKARLSPYICPLDPEHVDDSAIDTPAYAYSSIELREVPSA